MATQKITPFAAVAQITRTAINSMVGIINAGLTVLDNHVADKNNPHGVRGKNLADNPFFTVNQVGNTGAYSTAGGYPVDRWKLTSGTVTINANGTLTLNGTLVQPRETALGVTAVADVYTTSGTATISYNDTTKIITLTSSGGTIKAVSLELGAVSTFKKPDGTLNEAPPDTQPELAKCRRYYRQVVFKAYCFSVNGSDATLHCSVYYPDMRTEVSTANLLILEIIEHGIGNRTIGTLQGVWSGARGRIMELTLNGSNLQYGHWYTVIATIDCNI